MRHLIAACAVLFLAACAPLGLLRDAAPRPAILHPQVSRVEGEAYLQPRHNRDRTPLKGPTLLEPGDWIETGAGGKVELLLPGAAVRLYRHTRVQVPFAFEDRTAVSRELVVEGGEALVDVTAGGFTARTGALEVEVAATGTGPTPGATLLVGARDSLHEAACYRGKAEARNVRVRGQTVVRMEEGQRLSLDDAASLAVLRQEKLPDEWRRWERANISFAGLVAAPTPQAPAVPEPAPQPTVEPAPPAAAPAPSAEAAAVEPPEPRARPIVVEPLPEKPAEAQPPQ